MRIGNLRLTNFRSHAKTELALNRINIFRGPNGSGKSSIQMAIEYALTGRCDVTDAAGRGADELIRTDAGDFLTQAVVLCTGEPQPGYPSIPGVKFFELEAVAAEEVNNAAAQ